MLSTSPDFKGHLGTDQGHLWSAWHCPAAVILPHPSPCREPGLEFWSSETLEQHQLPLNPQDKQSLALQLRLGNNLS